MAPRWTFLGSCVQLDGDCINEMKRGATAVSYATLRRAIGAKVVDEEVAALGYDVGSMRGGLRISKDCAVGFFQGTYGVAPCFYIAWSGIEHVFVQEGMADLAGRCGRRLSPKGPVSLWLTPQSEPELVQMARFREYPHFFAALAQYEDFRELRSEVLVRWLPYEELARQVFAADSDEEAEGEDEFISGVAELIKLGEDVPPLVRFDDHWYDGHHRAASAWSLGIRVAPVIELEDLRVRPSGPTKKVRAPRSSAPAAGPTEYAWPHPLATSKSSRTTDSGWTLIRPPHAVAASHDWEPGDDDYVPQSRPSAALIKATAKALREVEDLAVELGLPYRAITIYFAVALPEEIGKYANGTGSTGPAILFDGPKLMRASRELHVPLYDAVFSTLVHELGHASIDAAGIELGYDVEEPIVEAFTQAFVRSGAPDWAARDLMQAAEAAAD